MAVKYFRGGKQDKLVASLITANATLINELKAKYATVLTMCNELKTDYNLTLAKLDADAGVTDTNYAATNGISAAALTAVVSPDSDTVKVVY